jgi:hypothetical protein
MALYRIERTGGRTPPCDGAYYRKDIDKWCIDLTPEQLAGLPRAINEDIILFANPRSWEPDELKAIQIIEIYDDYRE